MPEMSLSISPAELALLAEVEAYVDCPTCDGYGYLPTGLDRWGAVTDEKLCHTCQGYAQMPLPPDMDGCPPLDGDLASAYNANSHGRLAADLTSTEGTAVRDPLPIVCKLGDRLHWRDQKALVLLVAMNGDWSGGACQLADALGIPDTVQEELYRESQTKRAEAHLEGAAAVIPLPNRAIAV